MIAPVSRLTKKEIVWLGKHRCKHNHTYLEHYNCYLGDNPQGQTIGFFDIETTGFKADFSLMLCYCIKVGGSDEVLERLITKKEMHSPDMDKQVVRACVNDMMKFDVLVTHYGTRFDLPFTRSRARAQGIPFPPYGELTHKDTYYIARAKLQLSANRQYHIHRFLFGEAARTHLDPKVWLKASHQGDTKSLKYILDHCRADVEDLEHIYNELENYSLRSFRSV